MAEFGFADIKQSWKDSISDAQLTDTLRTLRVVEREKEMLETERYLTITDHLHSLIVKDSIPDSTYMMIHWLADSVAGKEWKMLAVGTALSLDTLAWARTLLENLDVDNAEDSAFYQLHDLFLSLREDALTWLDMTIGQSEVLPNRWTVIEVLLLN